MGYREDGGCCGGGGASSAGACHIRQLHIPRPVLDTVDESYRTFSPVVWDFQSSPSNADLHEILRDDVPWREKRDVALFRGALTGAREVFDREVLSDREVCLSIPRCRLVLLHKGSDLVDAKLTSTADVPMSDFLQKGSLFVEERKNKMPYKEQLGYKALIVMEGNDLAEGLRWSLLSRSVVLMPPPNRTSWAMEEWIEPWVHYIPLDPNLGNVEERMRWVLDNDEVAQGISQRATLFIYDLVLHPDAPGDDLAIKTDILRRYRRYFIEDTRYDAEKCSK